MCCFNSAVYFARVFCRANRDVMDNQELRYVETSKYEQEALLLKRICVAFRILSNSINLIQ